MMMGFDSPIPRQIMIKRFLVPDSLREKILNWCDNSFAPSAPLDRKYKWFPHYYTRGHEEAFQLYLYDEEHVTLFLLVWGHEAEDD